MTERQSLALNIISHIRRADHVDSLVNKYGVILNQDGSVYDRKIKRSFHNLLEWSREVSDEVR